MIFSTVCATRCGCGVSRRADAAVTLALGYDNLDNVTSISRNAAVLVLYAYAGTPRVQPKRGQSRRTP